MMSDRPTLGMALAVWHDERFLGRHDDGWSSDDSGGGSGLVRLGPGKTAVFLCVNKITEPLAAVGHGFIQPGGVGKARRKFGCVLEGYLVMFQGLGWSSLSFAEFPKRAVELLADFRILLNEFLETMHRFIEQGSSAGSVALAMPDFGHAEQGIDQFFPLRIITQAPGAGAEQG